MKVQGGGLARLVLNADTTGVRISAAQPEDTGG